MYIKLTIQTIGLGLAILGLFSFMGNISPYDPFWCWGGLVAMVFGTLLLVGTTLNDNDIY